MKVLFLLIGLTLFALPGAFGQASKHANKDLENLAAAEREFAAYTVENGFRDGFSKYFADDGIGFGPHPERTREKLLRSPRPTGPRTLIFNWAPMFGDISAAGDLGYTTGPVLFTDITANPKAPRHGIYFSVWQKQADASWKVVIDMGVDTPEAVAPIDTGFVAAGPAGAPAAKAGLSRDEYRKLDWNLSGAMAKTKVPGAYNFALARQFRIHRKGMMPVTELKDIPINAIGQTKFEFIDGKIAMSGDLAYTYGKYTKINDTGGEETGYYVHVWRREPAGTWKLAVDVANPLPKGA